MPLSDQEILSVFQDEVAIHRQTLEVLRGLTATLESVAAIQTVLVAEVATLAAAREGTGAEAVVRRIDSTIDAVRAALSAIKPAAPAA